METIDLYQFGFDYRTNDFLYEIQYVQFMIKLLEPSIDFKVVNTDESIINLAGEPSLKKGLKMFVKKEHDVLIQESIDKNQFIQFIQVEFPKLVKKKQTIINDEIQWEIEEKEKFQTHIRRSDPLCPSSMNENEFNSKDNYYKNEYNVKIESLRKKSKTLGEILLVNQTRHSTVQSVIHFLNIVKDHYVFES